MSVNCLVAETAVVMRAVTVCVCEGCARRVNLYNKSGYVCLFVPYGRPNGWADRDQT